jgi:hypothetical protein
MYYSIAIFILAFVLAGANPIDTIVMTTTDDSITADLSDTESVSEGCHVIV